MREKSDGGEFRNARGPETQEGIGSDEHKPDLEEHHGHWTQVQNLARDGVLLNQQALLLRQDGKGEIERVEEPDAQEKADHAV